MLHARSFLVVRGLQFLLIISSMPIVSAQDARAPISPLALKG